MTRSDALLTALLSVTYLVLAIPAFSGLTNPDLTAAWVAATAYADGIGPGVYGTETGAFTTLAPPQLAPAFDALDYPDNRYAYVYAPLWLALLAPVTAVTSLDVFLAVAIWINVLSVLAMSALVWRLSRRSLSLPLFLLVGLALQLVTYVTGLALYMNQVQIIVSLLILVAAERDQSQAPVAAGLALALAAALKSYPILLAIIWIARRDRRALTAFACAGAGLGGLSVVLTGWEMHAAFLDQLAQIAGSVILTPVTISLPSFLANLGIAGTLAPISPNTGGVPELWVAVAPTWLRLLSLLGLFAVLAVAWRAAEAKDGVLWVVAAGGISMMSSVSWSFHYMAALAAVPILMERWGVLRGGLAACALTAPLSFPLIPFWQGVVPLPQPLQGVGTLAVLAMLACLAISKPPRTGG